MRASELPEPAISDTAADARLLIVNFHHVRPRNPPEFGGLHHVSVDDLRRQIELVGRHFDFADPRDLSRLGLPSDGPRTCVLTFDDGLRDHYEHAAPMLESLGIHALFAICTEPWITGQLLPVHQAHLLSAAFSYEAIARDIERAAREAGATTTIDDVDGAIAARTYSYDTVDVARVKYFLNVALDQSKRAQVLGTVFHTRLGADPEHASRHYLSPTMVNELFRRGHSIGLHSHAHLHLASASHAERVADLSANRRCIREALQMPAYPVAWISYPYGSPSSYDDGVIADARSLGCEFGLSMTRAINSATDVAANPMRLSRLDTNDAPGGKRPLPFAAFGTADTL